MNVVPRDYQIQSIEATHGFFAKSRDGVLIRQPTGTGKTVVGCFLIHEWIKRSPSHRAIVIAHEQQLIWQFRDEIEDLIGITPEIEMSGNRVGDGCLPRIIVASRASLVERLEKDPDTNQEFVTSRLYKFSNDYKWLVIIDECHRYKLGLKSFAHIYEHFRKGEANRMVGLTATPERGDKISLGTMFPNIACDYRLFDVDGGPCAVRDGWAVPYDQRFIVVKDIDFKGLRVVAGDFTDAELEEKLGAKEVLAKLLDPMRDLVEDRCTLIFSPGVKMAHAVAQYLNAENVAENGPSEDIAYSLDGTVSTDVRKDIYKRFSNRKFQFLSVCGLCIARDSLILTDQGEVPIQDVTVDMRVWDGVEFVYHSGVIYNGRRSVIEYAGLRATEDHNVWTADGWKTLAECKEGGLAVAVSGIGGCPVREVDDYYWHGDPQGQSATLGSQVQGLPEDDAAHVLSAPESGIDMPCVSSPPQQPECPAGIRANRAIVLQKARGHNRGNSTSRHLRQGWRGSSVRGLRKDIRETSIGTEDGAIWMPELCKVNGDATVVTAQMQGSQAKMHESSIFGLPGLRRQGNRDEIRHDAEYGSLDYGTLGTTAIPDAGQNQQRRPLRAGESSIRNKHEAGQQSEAATEEVFDILNAGPRHRFTANGLIVSNCREGYNNPNVEAITVLRPTKSRTLAEQMKGRGCRPHRGIVDGFATKEERVAAILASDKKNCMVIDLVGMTGLADTITTADIMSQGKSDEIINEANRLAMMQNGKVDMGEMIVRAENEIAVEKELKRRLYEEEQKKIRGDADRMSAIMIGVYYDEVKVEQGHGTVKTNGTAKIIDAATDKQKGYLRWKGIPFYEDKITKAQAGRLIKQHGSGMSVDQIRAVNKLPEPGPPEGATVNQIKFLNWKRISHSSDITKQQASALIDMYKKQTVRV